ncbi:MAG: flavodoxin domain-containing protein [Actinomycetota bacterium]|nr:flavodoxin domain-containing protein [Actinomycetota bacterium]
MIVVAFASKHGATEDIAKHIATGLTARGLQSEARSVNEIDGLAGADAVVLGSAVYAGSWMKDATGFVDRNAETLATLPVWLFSSGPLGDHVADDEEQPKQLDELRTRISPRGHRTFFGALDSAKLGFAERMLVKAVKAPEGDFRDWDEISSWTDEIADGLAAPTS